MNRLTDQQRAEVAERYRAWRVANGLSPTIDDERELRMVAAVIASSQERQRREAAERKAKAS